MAHRNEPLELPAGNGSGASATPTPAPSWHGDGAAQPEAVDAPLPRDEDTRPALPEPSTPVASGGKRGTPFRKGDPRTVEIARRAGRASARAARRRREESGWEREYWKLCDEDPARTARKLYELTNGYAFVEGFKLAQAARATHLRQRELAVKEREAAVAELESDAASTAQWKETADAWVERRLAEVRELERQRDELSAAIAAEAAEHDLEFVEGE